eukprot:SAG31_NODE_43800_length_265_cov_0.939759_1_plen_58_part_10
MGQSNADLNHEHLSEHSAAHRIQLFGARRTRSRIQLPYRINNYYEDMLKCLSCGEAAH